MLLSSEGSVRLQQTSGAEARVGCSLAAAAAAAREEKPLFELLANMATEANCCSTVG